VNHAKTLKAFSAGARVVAPNLLSAEFVYKQWKQAITAQQQPNFIPFNPYSGFETIGAWCAFSDRSFHSMMPLDPTPAHMKRA
jgi:hypothetical protein